MMTEQIIEVWKDVNGFEGIYQVSNLGRVRGINRLSLQKHRIDEKILKPSLSGNIRKNKDYGYLEVSLYKNRKRYHKKIHRLVAEAFVENPNGYNEVDHIDGNKLNNNSANLRWVTHQENQSNPFVVEKFRKYNLGKKRSAESVQKCCKPIVVTKNNKILFVFDSYKDLEEKSEKILGVKLWGIYVRQCINKKRDNYKGFNYKLLNEEELSIE